MSYTLLWKVSLVISTIGTTTAPSLHLQIVWESLPKGCVSPRTGIGRNHVYLLKIYHSAWHKIGPAEFAMTALELIPIFIYWIALVLWITSEPPAPFKGIPQSLSFWSLTLEDFCDFLPVFLLFFFFFCELFSHFTPICGCSSISIATPCFLVYFLMHSCTLMVLTVTSMLATLKYLSAACYINL